MRKLTGYLIAAGLGLLAVSPPIPYQIPLIVNSFGWLYMVLASALFGFFLIRSDLSLSVRALVVYLFASSFLSQAPHASFNAYALVVVTTYFLMLCREADYNPILRMVEAVFWLQVCIAGIQHFGLDILMNFGDGFHFNDQGALVKSTIDMSQSTVYMGTVFQVMRLGSLFAIMAPFLLLRSRWYIVPLLAVAALMNVSGLSLALLSGALVYALLTLRRHRMLLCGSLVVLGVCYVLSDIPSIRVSIVEGRIPVWWVTVKSWVLNTTGPMGKPDFLGISQTGPFDLVRCLFGHGLDTFLFLFPIYKQDPNPFPQAHNDWLQLLWEIGLIGFGLFAAYCALLVKRLYDLKEHLLLSGLWIIGFNMCFHFPTRMAQTIWLMVAYLALCEQTIRRRA